MRGLPDLLVRQRGTTAELLKCCDWNAASFWPNWSRVFDSWTLSRPCPACWKVLLKKLEWHSVEHNTSAKLVLLNKRRSIHCILSFRNLEFPCVLFEPVNITNFRFLFHLASCQQKPRSDPAYAQSHICLLFGDYSTCDLAGFPKK